MESILLETQYFPCLSYFSAILKHEIVLIESNENFQKQTLRNRCNILTSQGIQKLTIPILHSESKIIKDCKIDNSQKWQKQHLRSIATAYGKCAYFEHYFPYLEEIILSKKHFLIDLNVDILSKCLNILKTTKQISFTKEFTIEGAEGINIQRNKYNDTNPSAIDNTQQKYYQAFGNIFVNNLSILDLIMNEGTNANKILYNHY